jgi:hypothetical protein
MSASIAELVDLSRAEKCRNTAARLRLLAQKTRFPDTRDELLKLAVRFERLADRIEGRNTITVDAAD